MGTLPVRGAARSPESWQGGRGGGGGGATGAPDPGGGDRKSVKTGMTHPPSTTTTEPHLI